MKAVSPLKWVEKKMHLQLEPVKEYLGAIEVSQEAEELGGIKQSVGFKPMTSSLTGRIYSLAYIRCLPCQR